MDDLESAVREGCALVQLRKRSKSPLDYEWTKAEAPSFKQVKRWLERGFNVGVKLGEPSKLSDGLYLHVFDIDIRDPDDPERAAAEAKEALREMFPGVRWSRHPTVQSGSGGLSRHIYFVTQKPFRSRKLARSKEIVVVDGKRSRRWEIELFGTGKQVVLPPSVHPSGGKYRWLVEPDWEFVPLIDFDLIEQIADPDEAPELDSGSKEPMGLPLKKMLRVLNTLQHMAEDHDEWLEIGMAIQHELGEEGWPIFDEWSKKLGNYNQKENRNRWKSFGRNPFKKPVTMRTVVQKALKIDPHVLDDDIEDLKAMFEDLPPEEPAEAPKGDPDLSILGGTTTPAPEFPLEIFGDCLADFIARQARNVSAPVDFVAAAVLAGASTAIGNSTWVRIKPGFVQPPILWCMMIGSPSSKKSPAASIVTHVLHQLEKEYEPIYGDRLRRWERDKAVADMRRKQWEAIAKIKIRKGEDVPDMPANCFPPPEPNKRQTVITDATIEAFVAAQRRNPRGFMVFRNELAVWLSNMERYSASTERGAWLEVYDGDRIAKERVKDGNKTTKVHRQFSTILGGIQPDKLLEITAKTVADDGLQARFLPFWPEPRLIPMSDGIEDSSFLKDVLSKLYSVPMDKDADGELTPYIVDFSHEAFERFRKWSDKRLAEEMHVPTRLASAYGKVDGQVGRLALVLEYLWWACVPDFDDGDDEPPAEVSLKAVEAAIRFREDYLKHMQRRVFTHAMESLEITNARLIAEWIVDQKVESLTARIVRRQAGIKGIPSNTKTSVVEDALEALVSMNWLYRASREYKPKGGRPSKTYLVNPKLWELLNAKDEWVNRGRGGIKLHAC